MGSDDGILGPYWTLLLKIEAANGPGKPRRTGAQPRRAECVPCVSLTIFLKRRSRHPEVLREALGADSLLRGMHFFFFGCYAATQHSNYVRNGHRWCVVIRKPESA